MCQKRSNSHLLTVIAPRVHRYYTSAVNILSNDGFFAPGHSSGHQPANALLEQLHRRTTGAFDVAEASRVLGIEHDETGRLLVYLARRGWLSRVRRGLYVAVPLDARRSGEWAEDPWVVAERVFSPCYIGGWSACEHWDLTEQVFRTLLVVTARAVVT